MSDILEFGFYLHRSAYLVSELTKHTLRKDANISLAHFLILEFIDTSTESLNQQALAEKLVISKGGISKQLYAMEQKGLITRRSMGTNRKEHRILIEQAGKMKLYEARRALEVAGKPLVDTLDKKMTPTLFALKELSLLLDPNKTAY